MPKATNEKRFVRWCGEGMGCFGRVRRRTILGLGAWFCDFSFGDSGEGREGKQCLFLLGGILFVGYQSHIHD